MDDYFFAEYPSRLPSSSFFVGITAVQGSMKENSLRQDTSFFRGLKAKNLDCRTKCTINIL